MRFALPHRVTFSHDKQNQRTSENLNCSCGRASTHEDPSASMHEDVSASMKRIYQHAPGDLQPLIRRYKRRAFLLYTLQAGVAGRVAGEFDSLGGRIPEVTGSLIVVVHLAIPVKV